MHSIAGAELLESATLFDIIRMGSYKITNVYKPPPTDWTNNSRRTRWEEMTSRSKLYTRDSSRKGWNLIRKLSSGQQLPSATRPSVKPNAVASHLVKVGGKAPIENQVKREITKEWRAYRRQPLDEGTATVTPISPEEVDAALKNMKYDSRVILSIRAGYP